MRRRGFMAVLGGAAMAWPLAARGQQPEQMRRIGVLLSQAESDHVAQSYIATFAARLRELGWTEGKNLLIDYRWGGGDIARFPGDPETISARIADHQARRQHHAHASPG